MLSECASTAAGVVRPDFQALSPSNYAMVSQAEAGIPDTYTIIREPFFPEVLEFGMI